MSYNVTLLSLGCAKNRVDAEIMLSNLRDAGYNIVPSVNLADIVVINTCGFVDDAKIESIEEIISVVRLKNKGLVKAIIVTGCLAERYKDEVLKEIPEVDAVVGIGANGDIVNIVKKVLDGEKIESFPNKLYLPLNGKRLQTTPKYYAYLKIADGCDNRCSYCAIPLIRGKFRSRKMEDIIDEAQILAKNGVKELLVIAQDTTRYGEDIYGELKLAELLKHLCEIDGIEWIRILYCYPDRITDELIYVISKEDKILNYIDIPLQHCNGKVLKNMNRRGNKESLTELLNKIRAKIPNVILRTTFICGFPGETDEEFNELAEFAKEMRFERMGCFAYSQEEGTTASKMNNQIDDEIKFKRQEILMEEQMKIMEENSIKMLGKTISVLFEGYDEEKESFYGRSMADSPDVDGRVYFSINDNIPKEGEFINVKINDFETCDLFGEMV